MSKEYTTLPPKVLALRVSVGDLFRIADAIVETGGQAAVEETDEVYVLKVLTKDWRNMMRAHGGQWVVLYNDSQAEILSNSEFESQYRPDNPELTLFADSYGLPLTEWGGLTMTRTSHGHHIPGSPKTDDGPLANVARCGGPNLCDRCFREAARYQSSK